MTPTQSEQSEISQRTDDLVQKVETLTIDATAEGVDEAETGTGVDASPEQVEPAEFEPPQAELHSIKDREPSSPQSTPQPLSNSSSESDTPSTPQQLYADPSGENDDGEGEWITPQNVGVHKSRALDLLPDDETQGKKGRKRKQDDMKEIGAGCMTADFAMQNVLLQMGLDLVSVDGKRIQKVRNYVLRCHACFK